MPEKIGITLKPEALEFVESTGLFFEIYGLPRIGGRILGLLMLSERPLSLHEIATALKVSRASVSTNVRLGERIGLIDKVGMRGQRRDYYESAPDAWEHTTNIWIEAMTRMRQIARLGLVALPDNDTVGKPRMEEMMEYCDLSMHTLRGLLHQWQERTMPKGD